MDVCGDGKGFEHSKTHLISVTKNAIRDIVHARNLLKLHCDKKMRSLRCVTAYATLVITFSWNGCLRSSVRLEDLAASEVIALCYTAAMHRRVMATEYTPLKIRPLPCIVIASLKPEFECGDHYVGQVAREACGHGRSLVSNSYVALYTCLSSHTIGHRA